MTTLASRLPIRRPDLVIRPVGEGDQYVVKDPKSREFFQFGEQEHFLLMQFGGENDAAAVCAKFEQRFKEPLSEEDLVEFIETAREQRLLQYAESERESRPSPIPQSKTYNPNPTQSILYWRKKLFDPDRFFNWLEPRIRFFWTRGFLILSAGCIVLASLVLWTSSRQIASSFTTALRWETMLLAWLTLFLIGILHECAHGLTCKHHGGEVREIGLLMMYFMPCYYCNVSDAWLFREKSKRLWVMLAGGYFELFVWALAVFVWRVTMPGTLINYLSFLVVAACGIDSLFNFNPLIKLDGYYLLSDWFEVPNLRQRSLSHLSSHLRWILWGGPKPDAAPRGRFLLTYGLTSWLFSLFFVAFMLVFVFTWLHQYLGAAAVLLVGLLGMVSARGLIGDLFRGELMTMIWHRHRRTCVWGMGLASIAAASLIVPWTKNASGPFEVRARTHVEIRAPVAGFLQEVSADQGQHVTEGGQIARLGIPDLDSRLARKQAELREAQARLRLLQAGTRAEEIAQQQRRVAATQTWRDVAARNLTRQQEALTQELMRFDQLLKQYRAECDYTRQVLAMHEKLRGNNSTTQEQYLAVRKACLVACARYAQTEAEKRARAAIGTALAESDLAERDSELAHQQATLALLEAGTRPEEIEAAQATAQRLREEVSYLEATRRRMKICSPVAGVITSERVGEKVGDYFDEGELICEVEDSQQLEIVIALDEDQADKVQPGRRVRLKARSLPFDQFTVEVDRIAPRAAKGDVQSQVNVYCHLTDPAAQLRPGMTGYARIHCGRSPLAVALAENCLRFLRTEFWW